MTTMQPILNKNPKVLSKDWWYVTRVQSVGNIDKMIANIHPKTAIKVTSHPTEYVMNEQGEWDCQHIDTKQEQFLDYVSADDAKLVTVDVCTSCEMYFDERDEEWKF